ncbi:hypothetical protein [Uliginosibacterium aquaticum]|uniref:Class I SAM-dependent methyltransferase n=1 Tax=Uliginosibacterium aquaticum TaxID=2731212 RepID=A0ABX2IC82_9RHOO|nr:hypothetical protein [Uliginosibacterium aquaticum]NSL53572.1 hypothetical protein [Uliginosibacterium aquaticum]
MSALQNHLWNPSGGLIYHWRALRYRRRLWQPFVTQVGYWLSAWQPPQKELVIIGPSAGYTLNADFLVRFAKVEILEPDPLARALLRRRFPAIHFRHGQLDCFAGLHGPLALRQHYPQAAFLFANSLGQQLAQLDSRWPTQLLQALQSSSWASYHDVVAGSRTPRNTQARKWQEGESLEQLLAAFWSGGELELFDHGSFGVLPAQEHTAWSLTPRQHHLVGWTSISVEGSSTSMLPNTGIGGRS